MPNARRFEASALFSFQLVVVFKSLCHMGNLREAPEWQPALGRGVYKFLFGSYTVLCDCPGNSATLRIIESPPQAYPGVKSRIIRTFAFWGVNLQGIVSA